MIRALLLMTGLLFAAAAMAQQYKWVDKNGKTQYGDVPPPGVKVTPLRGVPPPASQPSAAAKGDASKDAKKGPLTPAEQEAEFRKRQQEAEKAAGKQAEADKTAEAKRENCSRAQEMARAVETGRVSRTDPKGERYYLDDAQLASERAKATAAIREWCG
jgi:hypothetical protein